jgi:hypothetical protein
MMGPDSAISSIVEIVALLLTALALLKVLDRILRHCG